MTSGIPTRQVRVLLCNGRFNFNSPLPSLLLSALCSRAAIVYRKLQREGLCCRHCCLCYWLCSSGNVNRPSFVWAPGINPQGCRSQKVIVNRGTKSPAVELSLSRENITTIATVNALGGHHPVLLIYKSAQRQLAWFADPGSPGSWYEATETSVMLLAVGVS